MQKQQKIYSNNCKIHQLYVFPPQINIHNNKPCLKQFNNFVKKSNFEFGHCYICNENKLIHEPINLIFQILFLN